MQILFHKSSHTEDAGNALDAVLSVAESDRVHVTCGIQAFIDVLLQYRAQSPIVMIQVDRIADIAQIKGLRDLLDGLFLIVITGNKDEVLFSSCRQLYPRLLARGKEDFSLMAAVVARRLSKAADDNTACLPTIV